MEILGRSIPNLQNAIASGLESVTAGIAESTKASGATALGIAQESFSFEQIGTGGAADLPAVSGAAEYPEPTRYFSQFSGVPSGSPISTLDIARTLTDSRFSPEKSLQNVSIEFDKIIDDAINGKLGRSPEDWQISLGSMERHMNDVVETKQQEMKDKYNEMVFQIPRQRTDAEGTAAAGGSRGSSSVEGAAAAGASSDASNRSIIVVGGKVSDASDRSIIVVGGKVSDASDRSIIVVGGKTYFQTIDDSLNQLRQNPTRQAADLFQQQFGAVQDMIGTVDRTVELQQSLFSKLIR